MKMQCHDNMLVISVPHQMTSFCHRTINLSKKIRMSYFIQAREYDMNMYAKIQDLNLHIFS
jgi:hypothetical protein